MSEILGLKPLKSHTPISSQTSLWVTSAGYFCSPSLLPKAFLRMSTLPDFSMYVDTPFTWSVGFAVPQPFCLGVRFTHCDLLASSMGKASVMLVVPWVVNSVG